VKTRIGRATSIMLCVVMAAVIAAAGNVNTSGASAANVALNAEVTLHGGPFFTDGWGGGLVVSEDAIVDGVFLPRFNRWDQGPVWWDSHDGVDRYIIIDLGEVYNIESFIVQADDNDAYLLYYWDIAATSWELVWHVPNYDVYKGVDLWGMQTRPNPDDNTERYLLPQNIFTNALMFKGDVESTDLFFAVSEIQAYGYSAHRYIIKALSPSDGGLGTVVHVTLAVTVPDGETATVDDTLPPEWKYIYGTFSVNGVSETPTVTVTSPPSPKSEVISRSLLVTGTYRIKFDAKVTTSY